MKRILIALGLIAVATASFGQGEINFANSPLTRLTTNSVAGGPSSGSTASSAIAPYGYYVAMFIANPTVTQVSGSAAARFGLYQNYVFDDPSWTMLTPLGTNIGVGRFGGANGPQDGLLTPGFPSASSASFVAIAWSANIGSTINELRAFCYGLDSPSYGWGAVGQSQVGANLLIGGLPSFPPSPVFGTTGGLIPGWMLGTSIPEPATFTLIGLGAAAMLVFRRRRK